VVATITQPGYVGSASGILVINKAPLTVTANIASRVYGAPNPTLIASITGFVNGETISVVSGAPSLTTTAISTSPVGTYPITAAAGTLAATNYSFTSFVNSILTITQANTLTTLTSSVNPSVLGQSVTLTATVIAISPGTGTPGSSVSFYNDKPLGTVNVVGGQAVLTTTELALGTNTLRADYSGDTNYAASSGTWTQTVNTPALQINTSSLSSGIVGTAYSQQLTASNNVGSCIWSKVGGSLPGGLSLVQSTGVIYGTPTASGTFTATFKVTDSVSSATKTLSITIVTPDPRVTKTTVTSSYNPSVTGQSVTFVATVTSYGGIPTGSVTFKDTYNGVVTTLGTVSLNKSGKATLVTTGLKTAGVHSITATYAGSKSFNSSLSDALLQTVNQANTTTTLKSSSNPSRFGRSVTFTATVSAQTPGSGTPTGTVRFIIDGKYSSPSIKTLNSGVATLSISSLSKGTHSVVVIYDADNNYNSSTSSTLYQIIN